jgi:DNA polymerase-3 subunit epsilon
LIDFTAIDVETANPNLSSVCQIGIAEFRGGSLSRTWKLHVDPEDYFDPVNVSIHGIRESDVVGAPAFREIAAELHQQLAATVVCHHTMFDRSAIRAAHARHGLAMPDCQWLDTARVVRRTWPERSHRGFGLRPIAMMLGIEFRHHDSEEDARTAGQILMRAIDESGLRLEDWISHAHRPLGTSTDGLSTGHRRDGNAEGSLYGETAVFTGSLSMPRREAADLAAAAGCDVRDGLSKTTTLLIVGDQDVGRLAGHTKSSKHRDAEARIQQGQPLRILTESDFLALLVRA